MSTQTRLYYVHDPMCSWCWAFRPTWLKVVAGMPPGIRVQRLLGGLAPDSRVPMEPELQLYLQQTWRRIQQRVPGSEFNFDFWRICQPRRSTYPACRAVIAAREQDGTAEERMIHAIQQAYYLQARNPSDDAQLVELADGIGLDAGRFAARLSAAETNATLLREIEFGQRIGAQGFPSLILQQGGRYRTLDYDYNDPQVVLDQL
ncbi:MAG: DsbA family protein [Gammaproteobacteria bacterium]|nr:DsbA family protein [Gammaproteobacteria bacterium]